MECLSKVGMVLCPKLRSATAVALDSSGCASFDSSLYSRKTCPAEKRIVSPHLKNRVQFAAYQLVLIQLLGVLLAAAMATLFISVHAAIGIILGGCAYVLTNLIFVWRVFRHVGAREMTRFVTAFFFGEMSKMVLSAILILLIVKYLPVSLLSVLIGLMIAIVSFWVACIWFIPRQV